MRRVALVGLAFAAACYSRPEGFIQGAAKHTCKRLRECNKSIFENQYEGDLGTCIEDRLDVFEDAVDVAEDLGCEYIPEEGRECIAALRSNRNECTQDAEEEIAIECGVGSNLMLDYFDCR